MAAHIQAVRALTVHAQGRLNQIITEVHLWPAYDPQHPPSPLPKSEVKQGLWDTGASGTCISPALAGLLALSPQGQRMTHDASGVRLRNTYMVNIGLPNRVAFPGVLVGEFDAPAQLPIDVLIGMDLITAGDFAITNANGKTVMSYRCPPVSEIDFVKQHSPHASPQPQMGRNELCYCGSGKKFKRCHGAP